MMYTVALKNLMMKNEFPFADSLACTFKSMLCLALFAPLMTLAISADSVATQASAGRVDASAERQAAIAAETAGQWDVALRHYETIYDSTETTQEERVALRNKFTVLHPKVEPNTDPKQANVYDVRVYVFRTLALDGRTNTYTDTHIDEIRATTARFAEEVWTHTHGNLRVAWDLVVIEKPLTRFRGFPDPRDCVPFFTDLKPGEKDFVMAYVNAEGLNWSCWASTWGPVCKGAMYVGINDKGSGYSRGDAEVQFHEWLHAVEMTVEWRMGYPDMLAINPDSGRGNCGKGCWQEQEERSLYNWYRHMTQTHLTRKMWHGFSTMSPAPNAWLEQLGLCPEYAALGPFAIQSGKPEDGFETPYIDESDIKPAIGEKVDGLVWSGVKNNGKNLSLSAVYDFPTDFQVAYLATVVVSDQAQHAQLRIGSDDSCKIWHNGELILAEPQLRQLALDQNIVEVDLEKGSNLFVMKVINGTGLWEAALRLTDASGTPLPDVAYRLPGSEVQSVDIRKYPAVRNIAERD